MNINRLNLNPVEEKTFRLHLFYSIIEGIIAGVLALNEFVFIKSLKGSNYQLGFLFQFTVIVLVFSIFLTGFLKRVKNKKKLLRITGIVTRIPLIALLFFPASVEAMTNSSYYHYIFLFIFLIYFSASPIILPIINLFLKNNYSHNNFGKLFSYSSSVNKIVMLIVTFCYGLLLDNYNFAFTYVFPVIAILGIISIFLLSKINFKQQEVIETPVVKQKDQIFISNIRKSFSNIYHIIKNNKSFRDFELGFMFYGIAFMLGTPITSIFFEQVLDLNYSSVAFYKNSYNILAIIMLPYFGRLLGKIDPRKFGAITFSSLMLFFFFLALSEYFPYHFEFMGLKLYYMLIIAYLFHGVFAATMSLLWNIGSAYFCKKEEAGEYQSIHLTLTGIRGAVAPLMGIALFETIGFFYTFMIAVLFLLISVLGMFHSVKKNNH